MIITARSITTTTDMITTPKRTDMKKVITAITTLLRMPMVMRTESIESNCDRFEKEFYFVHPYRNTVYFHKC